MAALSRLLRRLHSVFDKEPGRLAVIRATGAGVLVWIEGGYLYANVASVVPVTAGLPTSGSGRTSGGKMIRPAQPEALWDLATMTVQQVVDALNALLGVTATLLQPEMAGQLAWVLLDRPEESLDDEPNFYYPTSLLWLELATYGRMLDEQAERLGILEDQFYPDTASGSWLDYWGRDFFGVPRDQGESDTAYARRMVNEILRPVPNNVALEKAIEDALGLECTISDAKVFEGLGGESLVCGVGGWVAGTPGLFVGTTPNLLGLTNLECQFLIELRPTIDTPPDEVETLIQRGRDIARRWKAAGTGIIEALTYQQYPMDAVAGADSLLFELDLTLADTIVDGPGTCGGAWLCGSPRLVCGLFDATEEQIQVETLDEFDVVQATQFV